MKHLASSCAVFGFLLLSGCAGMSEELQMAQAGETVCKHCNCLMSAGTDPEATCAVCHCGFKTHQCTRGH